MRTGRTDSTPRTRIIRSWNIVPEAELGVDVEVSRVVQELHREVSGKYETYHGLSFGFRIDNGLGQGCVNAAERSKLPLTLIQRTIARTVRGFHFDGYRHHGGIPQLMFCDDAAFCTDSPHMLQLAYETSWLLGGVRT